MRRSSGEVLDTFASATDVLADEREDITDLVGGLADLSKTGLRIVGEHSTDLRADIETLADAAATIDANLSSVTTLLSAGNLLTTGLLDAYNPEARAIDLRNNFGPLVFDLVGIITDELGILGRGAGKLRQRTSKLRQAGPGNVAVLEVVTAYRAVLAKVSREALPTEWALTKDNLARGLASIADLSDRQYGPAIAEIDDAIAGFRDLGAMHYLRKAVAFRQNHEPLTSRPVNPVNLSPPRENGAWVVHGLCMPRADPTQPVHLG